MAMRERAVRVPHDLPVVVDTCGTGGDAKGTFNISTAAAIVAAAAGAVVAKHGNRAVTSRSGSADLLEALGVPLQLAPEAAGWALAEVGMTFLFAPGLHPAMREVMPIRRELGVRTVFNVLGPLTNPAGAKRQVLGVFSADLVEPLARVLLELGAEHALVVHGDDGLDEITTTDLTLVAEARDGEVQTRRLSPEDLGVERARPEDLAGGDAAFNAGLLRSILAGERGPLFDVTAVNAGAAIYVAGLEGSLGEGVDRAEKAIVSGAARAKLEALEAFS